MLVVANRHRALNRNRSPCAAEGENEKDYDCESDGSNAAERVRAPLFPSAVSGKGIHGRKRGVFVFRVFPGRCSLRCFGCGCAALGPPCVTINVLWLRPQAAMGSLWQFLRVFFAFATAAAAGAGAAEVAAGWSFDTGLSPEDAKKLLVDAAPSRPPVGSWLRLRLPGSDPSQDSAVTIAARRAALSSLREAGYRLVMLVRWAPTTWAGGTREFRWAHLPRDLREAFARGRGMAQTYGDCVDYWEIDNEPDIGFVAENPETYAAYLKACYLGIAAGRRDRPTLGRAADRAVRPAASQVLMAPLAGPPGPYFEALARNDALRYTDGFNYHFYGYAEDFTGAYRQFERAVADTASVGATDAPASHDAIFRTQFFPNALGWQNEVVSTFNHSSEAAAESLKNILTRPYAREEPALSVSGRWLVSNGVTVEELPEAWRFHVTHWPTETLRAPCAELPLPEGRKLSPDNFLAFAYISAASPGGSIMATSAEAWREASGPRAGGGGRGAPTPPAGEGWAPLSEARSSPKLPGRLKADSPARELPVFITEYGYGSLDPLSAATVAGRERQRRFFASTTTQIRQLGIEGAMAFLLTPYLERETQEFGLLMKQPLAGNSPEKPASALWGADFGSPALREILDAGSRRFTARRWPVGARAANELVIDFVATKGVGLAKDYSGYFLEGEYGRDVPGEGQLVVYNFATTPVQGELQLDGEPCRFPGGARTQHVFIGPGERIAVAVAVRTSLRRFAALPVTARFVASTQRPETVAADLTPVTEELPAPSESPREAPSLSGAASALPLPVFACYFRTENGNLYSAGPRLVATDTWQRFMQQAGNFTPTTFGRHNLPWRFSDNRVVSLVFFFYPKSFPFTIEVRGAQTVHFNAPASKP